MKQKIVKVIALTIMACFSTSTATTVLIDSVDVIPEQPLETDIITFDIAGQASCGSSHVEYDQFTQDGTSLQLDLYVDMGVTTVISYWTYEKQIGTLNPSTYRLEVRAFDNYDDTLQYTYPAVEFNVIPEPATILLLSLGAAVFLRRHRN